MRRFSFQASYWSFDIFKVSGTCNLSPEMLNLTKSATRSVVIRDRIGPIRLLYSSTPEKLFLIQMMMGTDQIFNTN